MIYAIIPARYQSTRFPGKPLTMIDGKPMIQRVYEQASKARLIDEVLIATDSEKIKEAVLTFGGKVVMTSEKHNSGTDRLAEVVLNNNDIDIAVNVQGDEPVIPPECIDDALRPFIDNPDIKMGTLIRKCNDQQDLNNPNIVKVVIDKEFNALYFSRSCIPYIRNNAESVHYLHIGLYVYRRETLLALSNLPQSDIEKTEGLEQLRALYNNIRIKTVLTDYSPIGVDIPEDVEKVEQYIKKSRSLFGG
ncbi:MAG: 3-deoxy-manno-octulosonate cytidylyltransferase [Cyanobacteriota bacterium]